MVAVLASYEALTVTPPMCPSKKVAETGLQPGMAGGNIAIKLLLGISLLLTNNTSFSNSSNSTSALTVTEAPNVHIVNSIAGSDNHNDTTGANSLPSNVVAGSTPHNTGGRVFMRTTKQAKHNKSAEKEVT